jgi:SAM-dependent methyltransferase
MPRAEWGADPEFFGPRHAYREAMILRELGGRVSNGGLHLECAAGVGSLSVALARRQLTIIAGDLSLRSLLVVVRRSREAGVQNHVLPVVVDLINLPFSTGVFASATSAETLEHVADDTAAVRELARVLVDGGLIVGTVPAGPKQWSVWDDWAGHLRRYRGPQLKGLLVSAGFDPKVSGWGWPLVRLYDALFLRRVNRRRLQTDGPVAGDAPLRVVAAVGSKRWLVWLVRAAFNAERLFPGARFGVGWLFRASKAAPFLSPEPPEHQPTASPTRPSG